MAEVTYKTIFQLKRGTLEAWNTVNPILRQGEPGFAYDANILRIGDGTRAWKDLPDIAGGEYSVSADGASVILTGSVLSLYGYASASEGQIPQKGANGLVWIDKDIPMTEEEILDTLSSTE